MARARKERELRRSRITVIGEGLTERWYFEHLRAIKGYRYDCKPRFFAQQSYEEMIETLSLYYNRARQASITQEITEIVAGAES